MLLGDRAVLFAPKATNCKINELIVKRGVDSPRTIPAGAARKWAVRLLMDDLNRGDMIIK